MKIFFARFQTDFGSEYEKTWIDIINETWPGCEIIKFPHREEIDNWISNNRIKNPIWEWSIWKEEERFFFPLIDSCDILVAAPIWGGGNRKNTGKFSLLVDLEIKYALNKGKRVIGLINNEMRDIKKEDLEVRGISGNFEIIRNILKGKGIYIMRDEKREYTNETKTYINNEWLLREEKKMLDIHNKMVNFYTRNPRVMKFLEGFYTAKKGYRVLTLQQRYPPGKDGKIKKPIRYLPYGTRRMIHFNEMDIKSLRKNIGQMHFLECIFDEKIKDIKFINEEIKKHTHWKLTRRKGGDDWKQEIDLKKVFEPRIIGISPVFDIDSPGNFFDYFDENMHLKCLVENELLDRGYECNSIFTGNGIGVLMQTIYFKDGLSEKNKWIEFQIIKKDLDKIMLKCNNKYKVKFKPLIDDTEKSWSIYEKTPFTYSNKWNRATLPVNIGSINRKWLEKVCGFDHFIKLNEYEIKEQIMNIAAWKRIW